MMIFKGYLRGNFHERNAKEKRTIKQKIMA